MAWQLTNSLDEFDRAVGEHLRADPVRQTVPLTVLAHLKDAGLSRYGADVPTFGWHQRPGGAVDGAVLQTPPFPLLAASLPAGSVAELVAALAAECALPAAVDLATVDEAAFLAAWVAATGGTGMVARRSRLYQLGELVAPEPAPAGAARSAGLQDLELLVDWFEAFRGEALGGGPEDSRKAVAERLSYGGLMLWETGGEPVAMAGRTPVVAGVARVAPVYTPPVHRGRGYGGAVTTAITAAALDRGATAVVLFTDLANPTSNALYQRLGYEPVEDRVVMRLTVGPDVTAEDGTAS